MLEIALPSGRVDVRIEKQFTVNHMPSLYNAQKYVLPEMFVKTLQHFTNVDLMDMLLEDFRYFILMFEKSSWPESHRIYEWRCVMPFYVTGRGERLYDRPPRIRSREVECNKLNTEEVARQQIKVYPWRKMPEGFKHPTVRRWIEHFDLVDKYGNDAEAAIWIDSDADLETTIRMSSLSDLRRAKKVSFRICELETKFKCNHCLRQYTTLQPIEILGHLRTYSDQSLMNMSLDLAASNKIYFPDDGALMKLLYWYSCYIKDRNAAEEERRKLDAIRKRGGRR
jgi:hypothetical protein